MKSKWEEFNENYHYFSYCFEQNSENTHEDTERFVPSVWVRNLVTRHDGLLLYWRTDRSRIHSASPEVWWFDDYTTAGFMVATQPVLGDPVACQNRIVVTFSTSLTCYHRPMVESDTRLRDSNTTVVCRIYSLVLATKRNVYDSHKKLINKNQNNFMVRAYAQEAQIREWSGQWSVVSGQWRVVCRDQSTVVPDGEVAKSKRQICTCETHWCVAALWFQLLHPHATLLIFSGYTDVPDRCGGSSALESAPRALYSDPIFCAAIRFSRKGANGAKIFYSTCINAFTGLYEWSTSLCGVTCIILNKHRCHGILLTSTWITASRFCCVV